MQVNDGDILVCIGAGCPFREECFRYFLRDYVSFYNPAYTTRIKITKDSKKGTTYECNEFIPILDEANAKPSTN